MKKIGRILAVARVKRTDDYGLRPRLLLLVLLRFFRRTSAAFSPIARLASVQAI
ncbi:hypothetical protein D3C86_1939130 [compost metagenome]